MRRLGCCLALYGFLFLFSCGTGDCEKSLCENNSTCFEGTCLCQIGYSGENCENQIQPKEIIIERIKVLRFASHNGMRTWDTGSDSLADIFIVLKRKQKTIYSSLMEPGAIKNAAPDSVYDFKVSALIQGNEILDGFIVEIFDSDAPSGSELIGGELFQLYDGDNDFPNALVLNAGAYAGFLISLKYYW